MQKDGSVIVSFNIVNGNPLLVVGEKRVNKVVKIINAFEGEKALELWEALTERRD